MLTMDGSYQASKAGRVRERTPHARPVLHPVGPCVGFYRQGWHLYTLAGAFRVVGRMWAKSEKYRKIVDKSRLRWGIARSKSVQVKGRVAFKSPLARFTPPGKAVRGFLLPPEKSRF